MNTNVREIEHFLWTFCIPSEYRSARTTMEERLIECLKKSLEFHVKDNHFHQKK